jgi:hypothetical protein
MNSDSPIHTDDSIINIPKKFLKKTYIKVAAEKEAEIAKRKALEKEYFKLKNELKEIRSSTTIKKEEIHKSDTSSEDTSSDEVSSSEDEESDSSSEDEDSSTDISTISEVESVSKKSIKSDVFTEKSIMTEKIIKENKENLINQYYNKYYAEKIEKIKKELGVK